MLNIYNPAGKQDFLKRWANEITKLRAQIADIMADQTLSAEEKASKIKVRKKIIKEHRFSIKRTKEYMKYYEEKNRKMYEQYIKNK